MPRYIVQRTLPPLTQEQLNEIGKKVVSVCQEMAGVQWIRSHLTVDGKHSFCEFEAPDADSCREHARRSGLPVDNVVPIGMEIGPGMFKSGR
ncbi:MAG TPA: DUF4242 domain-containing protein [Vicinamibacterales bacterium]